MTEDPAVDKAMVDEAATRGLRQFEEAAAELRQLRRELASVQLAVAELRIMVRNQARGEEEPESKAPRSLAVMAQDLRDFAREIEAERANWNESYAGTLREAAALLVELDAERDRVTVERDGARAALDLQVRQVEQLSRAIAYVREIALGWTKVPGGSGGMAVRRQDGYRILTALDAASANAPWPGMWT